MRLWSLEDGVTKENKYIEQHEEPGTGQRPWKQLTTLNQLSTMVVNSEIAIEIVGRLIAARVLIEIPMQLT